MVHSDIVRKVQGILARAERGSTEHERDTAMRMAQKLLFKHNLSMDDIGPTSAEAPGREFTREWEYLEHWSGTLLWRIGKVFFCHVQYTPDREKKVRHTVIGRRDNVQVTRELHAYIAQQIEGMAMIEVAKRGQCPRYALVAVRTWARMRNMEQDEALADLQAGGLKGDAGLELIMDLTGLTKSYAGEVRPFIKRGDLAPEVVDDLGVWRRSFLDAAVTKVYLRLMEMHREDVAEAGSAGTALVVNERAALEDFLGGEAKDGKKNRTQHSASGANAGSAAGARADISLGNKMGRGGTRLLGS